MIWWVSLALAEPLPEWVARTERAWQAAVSHAGDTHLLSEGVCDTSVELAERTLIVEDPACLALRERVASGDAEAFPLLAVHLRTLASEGGALLEAPSAPAARSTPVPTGALGDAPPVAEARELVGGTAETVREATSEQWGAEERRSFGAPTDLLVLVLAAMALVGFAVALWAQRAPITLSAPGAPSPPEASWPDTSEGRLRRRYAALFARLARRAGLDPAGLVDDELAEALDASLSRIHQKARDAVAPVAYGGRPADGRRRAELAWAEETLGEEER